MSARPGRATRTFGVGGRQRLTEAGQLDGRATVHDHVESGGAGAVVGGLVDDAELVPDGLGADGDGLVGDRAGEVAVHEHIDDVDVEGDVGQRGVALLAVDRLGLRVDGDDPLAVRWSTSATRYAARCGFDDRPTTAQVSPSSVRILRIVAESPYTPGLLGIRTLAVSAVRDNSDGPPVIPRVAPGRPAPQEGSPLGRGETHRHGGAPKGRGELRDQPPPAESQMTTH